MLPLFPHLDGFFFLLFFVFFTRMTFFLHLSDLEECPSCPFPLRESERGLGLVKLKKKKKKVSIKTCSKSAIFQEKIYLNVLLLYNMAFLFVSQKKKSHKGFEKMMTEFFFFFGSTLLILRS